MTLIIALVIRYGAFLGVTLNTLDRSTLVSALSTIATVVALFCSLSIAWILYVLQQVRTERLQTYDVMKSKLRDVLTWLHSIPPSNDRDVCLAHAYAIDFLDLSEMPQTVVLEECKEYCEALDKGLASSDSVRQEFFRASVSHFVYIESLMKRIGLGAVKQVISSIFIKTLAKGIFLVGVSVFALIALLLWYGDYSAPLFVCVSTFVGVGSCLLLIEVWVELRRHYDDELDFVASDAK
ncbi:MAG: hypothetical protein E2581_06800 [Pseudomonas sp.]|uniref:hypothetical protein n=1 Tax=unclassified Pseudomonas TaxID=196821 RepID=UPI00131A2662|nr:MULTISPECIES: hypothetical protein [unclassified Pseudomonas]MPS98194.1 hypothetical protein [Pseudomonas sp.]